MAHRPRTMSAETDSFQMAAARNQPIQLSAGIKASTVKAREPGAMPRAISLREHGRRGQLHMRPLTLELESASPLGIAEAIGAGAGAAVSCRRQLRFAPLHAPALLGSPLAFPGTRSQPLPACWAQRPGRRPPREPLGRTGLAKSHGPGMAKSALSATPNQPRAPGAPRTLATTQAAQGSRRR